VSTPELSSRGIPEKIRDTMVRFDVEEKTARQLLGCSAVLASENFAKWKTNLRRAQMLKATEILELIKKAENGDSGALAAAGSKLQAIITTKSWER